MRPSLLPSTALALTLIVATGRADTGPGATEEVPAVAAAPRAPTTWYALAAPFYLPETRLGLASVGGIHAALCVGCQASSLHLELAYTLNQQLSVLLASRLFVNRELAVAAALGYSLFPSRYHGIGPDSPDGGESFTPRTVELTLTPELYVIPGRLRVGPKLHLRREEIVGREAGKAIDSGAVSGSRGSQAVGLGASATWDTRDSQFHPRWGSVLEAWYLYYPGPLGHHPGFGRGGLDASRFFSLGGKHVLGVNGSLVFTHGDPPFTLLANLGGLRGLRGYAAGRYRDRTAVGLQAEYRFPILWRVSGVAFAGAGEVAPSLDSLRVLALRTTLGGGVRFRLTDDGVNLRADVAYAEGDAALYLIALEAF